MIHATPLLFALTLPILAAIGVQSYGTFVGTVKAEWLDDGRRMRLLEQFSYIDRNGVVWLSPIGSVVDGASIPRFAWSLIGGPFEGRYRDASVIHDVACEQKARPWELVHETFYYAMLASGVDTLQAKTMYAAVYYFGPRWPRTVEISADSTRKLDSALATIRSETGAGSELGVTVKTKYRVDDQSTGQSETAYMTVVVTPPERTMTESEFAQLKARIEERDSSASGGMSLEEIRKYKVAK